MEDYERLGDGRVCGLLLCFPNLVYITASLTRLYILNLQLHFLCGNYTARGVLLHSPSICLTPHPFVTVCMAQEIVRCTQV